jgi:hypothetical protein
MSRTCRICQNHVKYCNVRFKTRHGFGARCASALLPLGVSDNSCSLRFLSALVASYVLATSVPEPACMSNFPSAMSKACLIFGRGHFWIWAAESDVGKLWKCRSFVDKRPWAWNDILFIVNRGTGTQSRAQVDRWKTLSPEKQASEHC